MTRSRDWRLRHRALHWRLAAQRHWYRVRDRWARRAKRAGGFVFQTLWVDLAGLGSLVVGVWVWHQGPIALGVALLAASWTIDNRGD